HAHLGGALCELGQLDEGLKELHRARNLSQQLMAQFPKDPTHVKELAEVQNILALALGDQLGKPDAARVELESSVELCKRLAERFQDEPHYQVALGGGYCNLANMTRKAGMPKDSLLLYEKAIATLTPVTKQQPGDLMARLFLRNSHAGHAETLDRLTKYPDAVKNWDKAVELSQ